MSILGNSYFNKEEDKLLTHWKDEIKRAIRYRKQFGLDEDWVVYRDYYRHNFKEGVVNTNLVYANISSESPSIMYNFPHITCSPLRPGYEAFAYVMESVDNRLAYQQNLAEECHDVIIDDATCGTGIVILGYDSQYGYSLKTPGALEYGETDSGVDSKTYNRIEYESSIQKGMPWCLRCPPEQFLVPWGISRFSDTPWFAFQIVRPYRDVKADSKYDKKARESIQITPDTSQPEGASQMDAKYLEGGYPEELHPIFMWQIHDLRTGCVYTISDGCNRFLRNESDVLQTRLGLPAETLQFTPDPIWFWGIPEVRYYEAHQKEMNEIIAQRRAFRRSALLRFLHAKGAIDRGEMSKMMSGEPVMWIEVDSPSGLKDSIETLQPVIPPSFTDVKDDIWNDVRTMLGKSKPYMGEQLGKTHITKYETQTAMQQASGRDMEKREKLGRFIARVMSKQNEIIFRHWNKNQVQQVIGPDLVSYWVEFTGSDLRSDYVLQVAIDDMAPVNRETKIKEAQGLLEIMASDQAFMEFFPDAAIQVRKTLLAQFSWLNIRSFEPREGIGGNANQPMSMNQFAGQFPGMIAKGRQAPGPRMEIVK